MAYRILVVEDDAAIALGLRDVLRRLGHDVIGLVSTGSEAVHEAEAQRPDVILMDISLAGPMTGIEAADHGTEAGAGDHMDGHVGFFEDFKHTEVGKSPSRPSAQRQTNLRFHLRSFSGMKFVTRLTQMFHDSIIVLICKDFF